MLTRARGLSTQALSVVNNVAKQQFAASVPGATAYLDYEQNGRDITFITTNVPEQFQGKGVGKLLAKNAFDYAYSNKLNVICQCHFLAKYYENNKDRFGGLKITFDLAAEQ